MPREASGELRRLADGFAARITITGRERRDFVLVARLTEAQAEERKTELARMAARLRRAGHADKIVKLIGAGAKARQGRPWAAVVAAVDTVCSGEIDALADIPTFADFAKEWTSGALRERFPDHVSAKDATPDESYLRLYINPHVGDVPVNEFALDDADLVMAHLPETKSSSTRRHVGQVIRRVLALAVYPARYLKENPIPRGWLPKVRQVKAFTHVYPDEDRALLTCRSSKEGEEGVPLVRRLFYGVLTREGMRRDELGHARWRDFDLTRGQVMLDENKTDDPRSWVLDPGVVRALRAWKECYCAGAKPDDYRLRQPGEPRAPLHPAPCRRPAPRPAQSGRHAFNAVRAQRRTVPDSGPRPPSHVRHRQPGQRQDGDLGRGPHRAPFQRHDQPLPARRTHVGGAGDGATRAARRGHPRASIAPRIAPRWHS